MFPFKSITWNDDVILRGIGKWGHYFRRPLNLDLPSGVSLFCLFVAAVVFFFAKRQPPKLAQKLSVKNVFIQNRGEHSCQNAAAMETLRSLNNDVSYQVSSTGQIWGKSPHSRLIASTFSKLQAFKVVDDLKSSPARFQPLPVSPVYSVFVPSVKFCTLNWEAWPPRDR